MFYLYERGKLLTKTKTFNNCIECMLFLPSEFESFTRTIVETYSCKLPDGKRKTFHEKVIEVTYKDGKINIKNFMNGVDIK